MGKSSTLPYISIEDLTKLQPTEADVTFEGHTLRVRGLRSGEVSAIMRAARADPLPIGTDDDATDRILTVCYGLVQPDLGTHDDLSAARLIVEGMEPRLRDALCVTIRALTWGGPTQASPSQNKREHDQTDDHDVGPEHEREQAGAGQ